MAQNNKKKKLYLVSREVMATSVHAALRAKGVVYSVSESAQQPPEKTGPVGFTNKKKVV